MANQLYIKEHLDKKNIFPKNYTDNIRDKESNKTLTEILQGFNCYFLSYTGNVETTRLQVPKLLRKQGLWITYVDYEKNTITEYYDNPSIEDSAFKDSSNWREGNNRLVGDLSISANGNWVINGRETEFKVKGETGTTPLIRLGENNKFQVSYNKGNKWEDISGYIEPTIRMAGDSGNSIGHLELSMDKGTTWQSLSGDIVNNLKISKYIGVNENLPTSGVAEGTIYMKGPYYDENDTNNDNPIYRMWVYAWKDNTLAWVDNGEFTSIIADIVNDLTTGGADKALSAEMGKALYEIIGDWNSSNNESILNEIGEHYSEEGDSDYNKGLWGQMRNTRGRLSTLENQAIVKNDIVNNLTDGGPNKVLSAEMGKELYNKRIIVMTEEEFEHLQNPIEGSFYATYEK